MTPLRQRMLEDMRIRNFTQNTQRSYQEQVSRFARHFARSPEELGPDDVRAYQIHLLEVRKLSAGSRSIAAAALRFLYKVTLKRDWTVEYIPLPKQPVRLPVILSPQEVGCFLNAVGNLKHRVLLAVAYAAGLRVSEVTHLKVSDIDSKRMVLRVEQGKNQKDRYVMLSAELLERLRAYWKIARPQDWLFPGKVAGQPITRSAVALVCRQAQRRCGIQKPITPHSLRHAFATHLLESGTDVRSIQLLLGHRSLATTSRYLKLATSTVCATRSPFDLLPQPPQPEGSDTPTTYF